ncbi:MAG: hypothetical protein ACXVKH_13530, partial [Candidatus Angelobacter sp.]
ACRGPRLIAGIGKAKPLKHGGTEEAEGIGRRSGDRRDIWKSEDINRGFTRMSENREIARSAKIAKIAEIGKAKPYHGSTLMTLI